MFFRALCVISLLIFFISARNPFSVKKQKIFTVCVLKGTIIGERSFAHFKNKEEDLLLGIGEEIGGFLIIEIDCESLLLKNNEGKTQRLKIDESMKIGEGT